jgi:hypothetical protein
MATPQTCQRFDGQPPFEPKQKAGHGCPRLTTRLILK